MEKEIKSKAQAILDQLTLDEKIGMIHGAHLFETAGVERMGIPALKMSDGPMGVRQEFEPDHWKAAGNSDDYVTYLPCNSALASTWNRELAYESGSVLGEEARGRGKDVILAPGVNIKRSPLCGRNFEYFSEDPYLTKELAVPFIKGIQQWDVAACVKHFAVNNQETERLWVNVEIDEQALRDIYLPAFHDAVKKGDAYTVMGAYNRLYGEHCCESDFLLNQILRKEWEYEGVVISDWGGVHDTQRAGRSQLDIEMSVTNDFDQYCMAEPLKKMVETGEISESCIDQKVLRILMLMIRLHMLDGCRKSGSYNTPDHQRKVLEAARESLVLLKNENNRLPLKKEELKKILLIGENADCLHANGGGSAEIKALYEVSPLMGLKTRLGGNTEIKYVRGYCREEEKDSHNQEDQINWQESSLENGGGSIRKTVVSDAEILKVRREKLRREAVKLAKEYETVIYIGGLNHEYDCEGNDRRDMKLPYEQDILIKELLDVNPGMIIVLIGGSPVEMGTWIAHADTVVWGWYMGMEGGSALAEVLLGEVNPSGKLPETFYKTLTDCSAHAVGEFPGNQKAAYREGADVGYRYLEKSGIEPGFCFGHGLSYTQFEYREMQVDKGEGIVSCYVKNTGDRAGSEIVQLYTARMQGKKVGIKELSGFDKIYLEAGEEKKVVIRHEMKGDGVYKYMLGSSLRDIRTMS